MLFYLSKQWTPQQEPSDASVSFGKRIDGSVDLALYIQPVICPRSESDMSVYYTYLCHLLLLCKEYCRMDLSGSPSMGRAGTNQQCFIVVSVSSSSSRPLITCMGRCRASLCHLPDSAAYNLFGPAGCECRSSAHLLSLNDHSAV